MSARCHAHNWRAMRRLAPTAFSAGDLYETTMREHRRFAIDVILIVAMLVCLATGMTLQVLLSTLVRDIDAPVRHAAWLALGNGAVLLIAGVALLLRTTQPFFHKLEETQAMHQAVVATARDGIMTVDSDGLIRACNASACRIFGCAPSDALGRPLTDFMPLLDVVSLDHHWPVGNGDGQCGLELVGRRSDGSEAPLEVTGSRQRIGERQLWTGILRDISARKAAQRELQRSFELLRQAKADADAKAEALSAANAELDDFTYIVSHDLKEPLRGIRVLCEMVEEDAAEALDAETRQRLALMTRMCDRAEQQVADLFRYSRVGRQAASEEIVDLNEVAGEAIESLQHRIAGCGAVVRVVGTLPQQQVDRSLVTEALVNLIANALKFNHSQPPRVELGCLATAPPTLYVRDNGIGIEPRHHEEIFGIFRRLHGREKYEGAGAGLTIVRKIVAAHGGRIWVASQPGQGSTFYFTLAPAGAAGVASLPNSPLADVAESAAVELLETR